MICRRCLHRVSAVRLSYSQAPSHLIRGLVSSPSPAASSAAPANGAPVFTTPQQLSRPKPKTPLPVSIRPAGSVLKGLNYLKGREDPIALPGEEYPEWLWRCLDTEIKKDGDEAEAAGDEFSKSRKQRRLAAKQKRKREARLLAAGDTEALIPKVPLQQQTIDLPWNEEGGVDAAIEAMGKREEVTKAMRAERRGKIKEANYLKAMK